MPRGARTWSTSRDACSARRMMPRPSDHLRVDRESVRIRADDVHSVAAELVHRPLDIPLGDAELLGDGRPGDVPAGDAPPDTVQAIGLRTGGAVGQNIDSGRSGGIADDAVVRQNLQRIVDGDGVQTCSERDGLRGHPVSGITDDPLDHHRCGCAPHHHRFWEHALPSDAPVRQGQLREDAHGSDLLRPLMVRSSPSMKISWSGWAALIRAISFRTWM